MKIRSGIPLILALTLLALACAPVRTVRPLEKGEWRVSGSFGGPLIHFSSLVIPVPYTTLAGAYGLRNDLTVSAGFHTTAAAFGVIQTDLAATWAPIRPSGFRPGLSVNGVANLAGDIWKGNMRFWPEIDANAWWEYGSKKHFAYAGVSNWIELKQARPHGETQRVPWFLNVQAGNTLVLGKWTFTQEMRFLAPYMNNQYLVVDYLKPGKSGALGVYFGVSRRIGK